MASAPCWGARCVSNRLCRAIARLHLREEPCAPVRWVNHWPPAPASSGITDPGAASKSDGHAKVWRDAVNTWLLRTSGIPDEKDRAGNRPNCFEAEAMQPDGYQVVDVKPREAASGSKAVSCPASLGRCVASFHYKVAPRWFELHVQYFDQNNGAARYRAYLGGQLVDEWVAGDTLLSRRIDSISSTRRIIGLLALPAGDLVRLEGWRDDGEEAALDYVEIVPARPEEDQKGAPATRAGAPKYRTSEGEPGRKLDVARAHLRPRNLPEERA